MDRLTKTYEDGTHSAADSLSCGENSWEYKRLLIERVGSYEDTGLTPDQIREIDRMYTDLSREVQQYREIGTVEECREAREQIGAKWIPVEECLPEDDRYILLSFSNFSGPEIGRYEVDEEGGAFYVGDNDASCVNYGLFVNAWMQLPDPCEGSGDE